MEQQIGEEDKVIFCKECSNGRQLSSRYEVKWLVYNTTTLQYIHPNKINYCPFCGRRLSSD